MTHNSHQDPVSMISTNVIAGVVRISHEAIEDFVRRADEHIDAGAEADARPSTVAFLDDAVTNLRQLLAEYAAMRTGIEEIIKDFGPDFLCGSSYSAATGIALMRDALCGLLARFPHSSRDAVSRSVPSVIVPGES